MKQKKNPCPFQRGEIINLALMGFFFWHKRHDTNTSSPTSENADEFLTWLIGQHYQHHHQHHQHHHLHHLVRLWRRCWNISAAQQSVVDINLGENEAVNWVSQWCLMQFNPGACIYVHLQLGGKSPYWISALDLYVQQPGWGWVSVSALFC